MFGVSVFFFFKQKTAYEMRISDWSSDVCSSDLIVDYNARDVAIVQARAGGFVQRVYGLAPDDIVRAGAPIADVLVPEWGGAQQEYLALRRTGNDALARAERPRLVLLGMSPALIAATERSGRVHNVVTIRSSSAEHTSELQSLMRISSAVFCLKK